MLYSYHKKNFFSRLLFEQKKQNCRDRCYQISLVISNMKCRLTVTSVNRSEEYVSSFREIDAILAWLKYLPARRFKDGQRVKWLAFKGSLTGSYAQDEVQWSDICLAHVYIDFFLKSSGAYCKHLWQSFMTDPKQISYIRTILFPVNIWSLFTSKDCMKGLLN